MSDPERHCSRLAFGHHGHGPAIGDDDDDDDGACSVCDHPFGDLSHMCIGAAPRMAA